MNEEGLGFRFKALGFRVLGSWARMAHGTP